MMAQPLLRALPVLSPTRTSRVEILDPGDPLDRAAWLELWNSWPDREIMAHPDYVRLLRGGP